MALRLRGEVMLLTVRALATSSVLLLLLIAPSRAGADCCACLCPVGTPVTCFTTIINNNCPGGCPGCAAATFQMGATCGVAPFARCQVIDGVPVPSATPTETPTATPTVTATATRTATATHTATATSTATVTHTASPTASHTSPPTPSFTATRSATVSPTVTQRPSPTPTASPTPPAGQYTWLLDTEFQLTNLHTVPHDGLTFVFPYRRRQHSLDLQDAAHRFCTQGGLLPIIRLDLDPADCENQCFVGFYPPDSTAAIHIANMPALHRAGGGTFDVLVDTFIGCQPDTPPTRFRMPAAVTYASCAGDCDGNNQVRIEELTLAVMIALGESPASDCLADDRDGDGALQINELIGAVDAALQGCTSS